MNTGADRSNDNRIGKSATDENFPVGSILLPARLRPHVATFYRLAREMDDIADDPHLAQVEKLSRLDRFAAALRGEVLRDPALCNAYQMVAVAAKTGVPLMHVEHLIDAFRQDAVKNRYESWEDLRVYCALSASPVGRFLLDLHGEDKGLYAWSDPLCDVLQILNHLQDLKQDYLDLDRIYLPADMMDVHAVDPRDLHAPQATPGLRALIDDCLDRCEEMLMSARPLSAMLRNRRLAMEAAVIWRLAERLIARLRHGDPVAGRVALSKIDFVTCSVRGAAAGILAMR